jgi:hypothetical protein
MTMANIDSTTKRVDDPGLPNRRRLPRDRKRRLGGNPSVVSSSAATQSTARGSILWTLLLAGLVFSLVDIFYIANYLERTATVQSGAPIRDLPAFLSTGGVNSPKDDHPHPEESSSEHTTTGRSLEKPKAQEKGPIHISAPIKNPAKVLSTIKMDSPKDDHPHPEESSSKQGEHITTGSSVEKPNAQGKAQEKGPIQLSAPIKNPAKVLSINNMDSPKDDHPHPESSPEQGEHITTGSSMEKPKAQGKAQEKGPIQLSAPIRDPSKVISTSTDSPKDDHPHPESSPEQGEHTTTGISMEKPKAEVKGPIQLSAPIKNPDKVLSTNNMESPKDTGSSVEKPKAEVKGPIQLSAPIKNPAKVLSTNNMESPKDDHPHPESSPEQGEHTTTGSSMEKPKAEVKGPIQISAPIRDPSKVSSTNNMESPKDTGSSVEKPKAQEKGPIQLSTPIRDPSKVLSTNTDSPKDDPPHPKESSPGTEHAATGLSVEKPKDDSIAQKQEPIQPNAPIRDPSKVNSTDSPKDDHPHPESSPGTEHATTGISVEKPKIDSKDPDKGPILTLLKEAGIDLDTLDQTVIDSLPLWSTVVKLYGDKPRIVGLDTCEAFRSMGDPADHFLGVAGTFNTGTNLMAELFIANCHMPARMAKYGKVNRGIRWQVRYVAEQSRLYASCIIHHSMEISLLCCYGRNCNSHCCHPHLKGALG